MRNFLWVLLLGLSALAAAQNENNAAIAQLAEVSPEAPQSEPEVPEQPPVEDKAAQGILEAVSAVVGSFRPSFPSFHTAEEAPPTETSEAVSTDDSAVVEAAEANITEASVAVTTVGEEVTEVVLSKKEQKAVKKYNEATDKLLVLLAQKLQNIDSFPIQVDSAVLLALDQVSSTVATNDTRLQAGNTRNNNRNRNKNKNKNNNKRNKKNKKRNNKRKNRDGLELQEEDEEEEEEEGRGKKKNSNENSTERKKKNKNKNKNERSNENGDNDSNEKKKKKKNKNKNKRNRNNKKNKKNATRRNRQPKAMDDDEDEDGVAEGRRRGGRPINMKTRRNNMNNNKQNNKQGNRGKNKNKNRKNKNKGRSDVEARKEMGPVMPTDEELGSSTGLLTGLSNVVRDGDVTVDLDGKKPKIEAPVTVGPLKVDLKDKSRKLRRAILNTNIHAVIRLKVKNVARRAKISVGDVQVTELTPGEVTVIRNDLELQPDVITSAQEEVVGAIDTGRLGRVLKAQLEEILNKDDLLENLGNHPLLRN